MFAIQVITEHPLAGKWNLYTVNVDNYRHRVYYKQHKLFFPLIQKYLLTLHTVKCSVLQR